MPAPVGGTLEGTLRVVLHPKRLDLRSSWGFLEKRVMKSIGWALWAISVLALCGVSRAQVSWALSAPEPGACPPASSVVETCSSNFPPPVGSCLPINTALGCGFCAVTAAATGGWANGSLAFWRDGGTGYVYVSRPAAPLLYPGGFIDTYKMPPHTFDPSRSFGLSGPAVSITVQLGTGYIAAAINTMGPPRVEIIDPISPTTPLLTFTCTGVTSFDYVSTNCNGDICVLLTQPGGGKAFARLDYAMMGCTSIVPLGGTTINNEYLVPDIRNNWWVVTSHNGALRTGGTLWRIRTGTIPVVATFNGLGGRFVMPDLPRAEGDPCTTVFSDPYIRPFVYVIQQDESAHAEPRGRLMRIDQVGTMVAQYYWPTTVPPGGDPRNYGPTYMDGIINVDTDAPSPACPAPIPPTGPPFCGRVWVSLNLEPLSAPGTFDRTWDVFGRNLCGVLGCGLGGFTPNIALCPGPGCPTCPIPTDCRTSVCTASPYRTPFAKGNGCSRWSDLVAPCCNEGAGLAWNWPWPRQPRQR